MPSAGPFQYMGFQIKNPGNHGDVLFNIFLHQHTVQLLDQLARRLGATMESCHPGREQTTGDAMSGYIGQIENHFFVADFPIIIPIP